MPAFESLTGISSRTPGSASCACGHTGSCLANMQEGSRAHVCFKLMFMQVFHIGHSVFRGLCHVGSMIEDPDAANCASIQQPNRSKYPKRFLMVDHIYVVDGYFGSVGWRPMPSPNSSAAGCWTGIAISR